MFAIYCKDAGGKLSCEPIDLEDGGFNPAPHQCTVTGFVIEGSVFHRVDKLVWVDIHNKNAEVAMVLPSGVSDKVASAALSAAWQEWNESFERETELRAEIAEFEERRAHLRGPVNLLN